MLNIEQMIKNEIYVNLNELVSELGCEYDLDYLFTTINVTESLFKGGYDIVTRSNDTATIIDSEGATIKDFDSYNDAVEYFGYNIFDFIDEPIYKEPIRFFAVSDWFAEKLEENNEPIVHSLGLNIWGIESGGSFTDNDAVIRIYDRLIGD